MSFPVKKKETDLQTTMSPQAAPIEQPKPIETVSKSDFDLLKEELAALRAQLTVKNAEPVKSTSREIPQYSPEPTYSEVLAAKDTAITLSKQDALERERLEMRKLVRGRFDYKEMRGGTLEFFFTPPYKLEPSKVWVCVDQEYMTIPRYIVKHIKDSGYVEVRKHVNNQFGKPISVVAEKVRRYDFYLDMPDPELEPKEESRILMPDKKALML